MTETTENPDNWLNRRVSRRTVLKTAAGLVVGATAVGTGIGIIRSRDHKSEKPTSEQSNQPTNEQSDRILTPEETNKKIQEFIPKIDSVYAGVQITPPAEFPNTKVIRSTDPKVLTDKKMPPQFETVIVDKDYLTAEGVKRMAQNCNATQEPIEVRSIQYTKIDDFYINHLMEYCEGVGYALRYASEQTNNPLTKSMLEDWHKIHLGIYETIRITEPPMDPTPYYDLINKNIYNIPQK